MRNLLLILILVIFLSGCMSATMPEEKSDFDEVENTFRINGLYRNKGFPRGFYISELLWRWILKSHEHERIEFIKIECHNSNLVVTALRKGAVYFKKVYVDSKDYEIRDGKIHLHAFRMKRRPNDLSYGPSFQKEIFGLDIDGNIKYESKIFGLVLFRSFLPVLAADYAMESFERVD